MATAAETSPVVAGLIALLQTGAHHILGELCADARSLQRETQPYGQATKPAKAGAQHETPPQSTAQAPAATLIEPRSFRRAQHRPK